MPGVRVSSALRIALPGQVMFIGAIGLAVMACSSTGIPVQGANAAIGVQTSQLSIVVENKVGMPLTDVDVAILPIGGATEFKKYIGRLENAEKRDVSLGDFYGRDGTPLSLRVVRPRTVRVTAKDLTNNPYKVEVPWQ
jgi:hypothetical protein